MLPLLGAMMTNDVKLLQAALLEVESLINESFGVQGVKTWGASRLTWDDLLYAHGKGLGKLEKFCAALEAEPDQELLTPGPAGGTFTD
jgi:hypothetical protein